MKGFLILPVLLILLFGTPAFADCLAGKKVYNNRDYATALKEWKPLTDQGYADTLTSARADRWQFD